jgi:poly(3-hydroxybutyrate) depolymerase
MLYCANELKKFWNRPRNLAAQWSSFFLESLDALSPENPFVRHTLVANEMLERQTRIYKKPNFNIEKVESFSGNIYEVVENVVLNKPFCELRHFRKIACQNPGPKVLIVAPLSGHWATLLRDTIHTALKDHDVYVTDWRDASDVPFKDGEFGFESYVDYVLDYMRYLGGNTHVMAVCQPAVPVLVAVSLVAQFNEPCQPTSMILMGGPLDTRINPGEVNLFAKEHSLEWFEHSNIMNTPFYRKGAGRKVCPGFVMLNGFMSLNSVRHRGAVLDYYHHLIQGDMESADKHRKFYDEYRAVMDLPARYFLDSVRIVFHEHLLPKGTLTHHGYTVDPSYIKDTALLTIEGELDDISCVGQTQAAHSMCKNLSKDMKKILVQKNVGHYGIFNGRRFREKIYPEIASFIKKFDKRR